MKIAIRASPTNWTIVPAFGEDGRDRGPERGVEERHDLGGRCCARRTGYIRAGRRRGRSPRRPHPPTRHDGVVDERLSDIRRQVLAEESIDALMELGDQPALGKRNDVHRSRGVDSDHGRAERPAQQEQLEAANPLPVPNAAATSTNSSTSKSAVAAAAGSDAHEGNRGDAVHHGLPGSNGEEHRCARTQPRATMLIVRSRGRGQRREPSAAGDPRGRPSPRPRAQSQWLPRPPRCIGP